MRTHCGIVEAVVLALVVLCLASCSSRPSSSDPWLSRATRVRAYASPNAGSLTVDGDGHMAASGASADNSAVVAYPIKDGGWLSAVEVRDLKAGLSFGAPPAAFAACCAPRHAFLFYDDEGRYLGSLTVCFECGCTTMSPHYAPSDPKTPYLHWKTEVFSRIVLAHHLGPLTQPEAGL